MEKSWETVILLWLCPRHIAKLVLLEIGVPQKQCWIAIGSQILKSVWHFFLRIPQDWCRFNQFGFPNMINTMEYYRIVICLCSSLRPFSFSHHFPIFSHRFSHIFHNCRICVHNFRRFFPWKIIVQSFFPYVLWIAHDFPMVFHLKSAPLVHTAPFWKNGTCVVSCGDLNGNFNGISQKKSTETIVYNQLMYSI